MSDRAGDGLSVLRDRLSPWVTHRWRKLRPDAASDLPEPDLHAFDPQLIPFAAAGWPMKAAEEYRSAAVYAALQSAVLLAQLPLDLAAVVGAVAQDEISHAALALRMAHTLGAQGSIPLNVESVSLRLHGHPPRDRVLSILLAEVAMGETASCALFRAGRDGTVEPCTRAALSIILRDEARHARLGWEALGALVPELTARERDDLQLEAATNFAAMERQNAVPALRSLEAREVFDPALSGLGVLLPERRIEAFYGAVEDSIIPRLSKLGFDGRTAWNARYRLPAPSAP